MKILLIEPFFTGSHRDWALGLQTHSQHEIELLTLPGRHWKWRMHGGAVTLAREFLASPYQPDLILATDMLDLPTFLGLTRTRTAQVPTAVYFHENQLTYPWSPTDQDVPLKRDNHYSFLNYTTALTADRVFFNSAYHRDSFLAALPGFLGAFPDHREMESVEMIRKKSQVLPLGIDLKRFDTCQYDLPATTGQKPALILWNHRWEYDKNPEDFFQALFLLADQGLEFEVVVLGEGYRKIPPIFKTTQERLGPRILQFGYAETFAEYARWLWQADILPVTSRQDFFGASAVEAMYCGTVPLLPDRLAFPEHITGADREQYYYQDFEELVERLGGMIKDIDRLRANRLNLGLERYDWSQLASKYDAHLS